jgi:succinate-acetate transporter protein
MNNLKKNQEKIEVSQNNSIENIKKLAIRLNYKQIIVNRLDYYGNSIPLGAFCNAVSFILYGFYRCKVYSVNDIFLWGIILLFGGFGQITSGILEFIKGRTFTATLYLCYGFYCLSHYYLYILPIKLSKYNIFGINYDQISLCVFYGFWAIISLPITIASINVNFFYNLQCEATTAFFILRSFGEGFDTYYVVRHSAGILQSIAGFFSLYICICQLINEQFGYQFLPVVPFIPNNEIDFTKYSKRKDE